jgi:hypothetical protein
MMLRRSTLIVALLLAGCSTSVDRPVAQETDAGVDGCYTASVGDDYAFLDLTQTGDQVRGILEYAFAQKDSTWGLVQGAVSSESVTLDYQYISEGVLSDRSLVLTRTDSPAGLSGEGFTYALSDTCGRGPGWTAADVADISTDTVHDPENGYFVRVRAKINGDAAGYAYRCIATVTDADGGTIADWVSFGTTTDGNALKRQVMMTNIRPEQVEQVAAGAVMCEIR